ncbi:hypothetical protein [Solibacillus cecembensis]
MNYAWALRLDLIILLPQFKSVTPAWNMTFVQREFKYLPNEEKV